MFLSIEDEQRFWLKISHDSVDINFDEKKKFHREKSLNAMLYTHFGELLEENLAFKV